MKLACKLLRAAGYTTLEASEALEGIQLAITGQPDVILMDVELPGMDGLSATKLLKRDARTKDIPVVAVTAFAMEFDREKALAAGCSAYISKPYRIKDLYHTIDSLGDRPGSM